MNDSKGSELMQLCENITTDNRYYLPHHGVFKEDKIRVISMLQSSKRSCMTKCDIFKSKIV